MRTADDIASEFFVDTGATKSTNWTRLRDVIAARDAEADQAHADVCGHLEDTQRENERLEALFQQTDGMRCHSSWVAEAERLRRDLATARSALAAVREAFLSLRRMAAKPMKSWDAGECIDAQRVDETAEEALDALAALTPATGESTT
jgi:hypothetical protein